MAGWDGNEGTGDPSKTRGGGPHRDPLPPSVLSASLFCVKIVFKFNKELKREEGNQIKKLKSKILKIISKVSLASIK